jgi:hypothetical protein
MHTNGKTKMKFLMTYAQKPGRPPPTPEHMAKIGAFTKKNMENGTVVMTGGLVRPSTGVQLKCEGGRFSVVDGPHAETKELIDGFALVEVANREEALRVAKEFMELAGDGVGEVLQVFDPGPPQPSDPAGVCAESTIQQQHRR